jgi:predicted membrane-bound spermidine synthase
MLKHISVFLITLSGLILEVGLTRIYSASIWYHFAFVAISVALLGWGLGGFTVHLLKRSRTLTMNTAALVALLYAGAIPLCLWLLVRFPFELSRLPLYFLAPLLPFFLAGMALSIVFDLNRAESGSLYFADLVGAALGAVLVTVLLFAFGGEAALLAATIAPAVAAMCLSFVKEPAAAKTSDSQSTRVGLLPRAVRLVAIVGVVLTIIAVFSAVKYGTFRVVPGTTKAMRNQMDANPQAHIAQTGWNAYSRIDAVEGVAPRHVARLYIDSDAWTSIYEWDGRLESASALRDSYRALPFKLTPNAETLVIGPGGGADVVSALSSGSRKVTAVELNPLMLKFVRSYGARAGNIYDRPDVETIQSEGRNFISRTDRKFDIIFMGFVDSWASVASGGLSLSENYLYTTEAFRAYYDHLSDNGILVVLRWETDIPRLVTNSVATLGADAAGKRIVALLETQSAPNEPKQMLFMLRKRPFTEAETTEISQKWTQAKAVILPGVTAPDLIGDVLSGRKTLAQYETESPSFVSPVWDDSPFYFAIERPFGMPTATAERLIVWLVAPSIVMLVLFAIFGRPRQASIGPYVGSLIYFAALGFGFIAVELALLQNLTLLVGHPIFTLSVLLFTLLAMGGIGSKLSPRLSMRTACLVVAAIGAIEAIVLPQLVIKLLPLPLWGRILIAMVLIAPLGLAMGMPFPRGLSQTGRGSLPAPPFYWGLNGIMSVIGSVATVFLALMMGFRAAMLVGCVCYVLAASASRVAFRTAA